LGGMVIAIFMAVLAATALAGMCLQRCAAFFSVLGFSIG
jgi:hypothetical protein